MNARHAIRGLLIDLDGVLYVGDHAIDGAAEAIANLRDRGLPLRFVTNTTSKPVSALQQKLQELGFAIGADEIVSAPTAAHHYLRQQGWSCHLVMNEAVKADFDDLPQDDEYPDVVVIGDIGRDWDYPLLNRLFRLLMDGSELIALHKGRFWQVEDGLALDIGAFVAALEYATGKQATVMGKPSADFYRLAAQSLDLPPEEIAMVGDDIDSDVGGAQAAGLTGILVKTGKYREEYARRSSVTPERLLDSIADLPDALD